MENKELLIEAIDNSLKYTLKQRDILKLFLNLEVNELVSITPRELAEMFNVTRATIYLSLNILEKDGLIKNMTEKGRHFNIYRLSKSNLNDLLQVYTKKKDYLKKI